ncbi:hypothetical protein IQ07DRAFT_557802 [Pyrenochaeta sp. DS3sAY3a]|nr:hypothetical protein IQ07DRAFT_557802 [Pyrenochaeta sp. DS3sAY3a]
MLKLVEYPDSSSGDDEEQGDKSIVPAAQPAGRSPKPAAKRRRIASSTSTASLPPLPAAFHDLYANNARVSTSDDPALHGGRRRAVPHVDGNWPSHVYLEWIPSQTEADSLHALIHHIQDIVGQQNAAQKKKNMSVPELIPSLTSELGVALPLHVSMSRTLQIKTEDREAFVESLQSAVRKSSVRVFYFTFSGLKWVPNFERNRWFLALSIKKPEHDELNKLLNACNHAARSTGHAALYTGGEGDGPMQDTSPPSAKRVKRDAYTEDHTDRSEYFHISIAWNLTEPNPDWISKVQDIDVNKHISSPQASIDSVKARVGNIVHNIPLAAQRVGLGFGGGPV